MSNACSAIYVGDIDFDGTAEDNRCDIFAIIGTLSDEQVRQLRETHGESASLYLIFRDEHVD